nr:T9SS type A sorting domain-containing protein [Saprospiraceae bacterium]
LQQNTPNPFTGKTLITYYIPKAEKVNLTITDLLGKNVFTKTVDANAGINQWLIEQNKIPASGIYYYSIEAGNFKDTKKMVFVK